MTTKSLPDTTLTYGQSSDAINQWKSSDQLFKMKEYPPDGLVSSEVYLGTKMNRKALDFHTQLHDWSESQKLSSLSVKQSQIIANAKNKDVHLPVQKLAHIDHWTKQVNRYYLPSRGLRPKSGSFMRIDVSKYNMKVDKTDKQQRSQSALYRPISANSRFNNNGRKRFFGNDFHTVKNNLVESQMHYSAQRRDLHSAATRRSTKSSRNIRALDTEQDYKPDTDIEEPYRETSDVNKTEDNVSSTLQENGNNSHIVEHTDNDNLQPQIVARSWSNRMLNVITIDDCKLTCRYRPQVIKENHIIPDDYDDLDRARAHKGKKEVKEVTKKKPNNANTNENGNEADDEGETTQDETDAGKVLNNHIIVDTVVDTNNNNREAEACHDNVKDNETTAVRETTNESKPNDENIRAKESNNIIHNGLVEVAENFGAGFRSGSGGSDKTEEKHSSQVDSRTSYGRLTNLYSNSSSDQSNTKEKKKKMTRTSKINHAIEDMVQERKVMNSLERDFESRTAPFGRTIVDKSEGSESFKKRHANLRKKIDEFVNTHSALKSLDFYERRRINSASNSTISSVK